MLIRNTWIKVPPGFLFFSPSLPLALSFLPSSSFFTVFAVRAEIPVRLYLDVVSAKFDCAIEAFYGFTCRDSLQRLIADNVLA